MNQQGTTFNVTPCSRIAGGKLPIDHTIKGNEKKRKQKKRKWKSTFGFVVRGRGEGPRRGDDKAVAVGYHDLFKG